MIVKTNVFGIDGGRLVLGLFYMSSLREATVFCKDTPIFILERLLSCVKIALISNLDFSKACPEAFI